VAPATLKRFQGEIQVMRKRWGKVLDADPFYGPLFNKLLGDYSPANPPRRTPPWKVSSGSRR